RSGSFAVLDDAPGEGSALSVWAWTRLPARGRRQVLLARGQLELFLDADGRPSVRIGEVCLSAPRPLGRETWTRLGVSFAGGRGGRGPRPGAGRAAWAGRPGGRRARPRGRRPPAR